MQRELVSAFDDADADDAVHRDGGGRFTLRVFDSLKPVIAAINGPAVGVGATMTLPMDVRLAADDARIGFVFARRGIVPEACSSWFLPRVVGISRAMEWVATGRVFLAREGLEAGLLRSLHPREELLDAARALALEIAETAAPVAVALASRRGARNVRHSGIPRHGMSNGRRSWRAVRAGGRAVRNVTRCRAVPHRVQKRTAMVRFCTRSRAATERVTKSTEDRRRLPLQEMCHAGLDRRRAVPSPGPARRLARTTVVEMTTNPQSKTWFITGTSRGFGREWAIAALRRGDRVAGTARDTSAMDDLVAEFGDAVLPIQLDVTDREADFAAVQQAHDHFGRLDIVVNNAGYGQFGMVEELSEQEARDQIETNLFGALWITQAALPYLREQGSGHIIQVSSIGGISAFPGIGMYHASKWGLEGISQALAQEVKDFGIHVTLIEPGGFSTDWGGASAKHAESLDAYEPVHEASQRRRAGNTPGDPQASAEAILRIVDADEPPLRAFFGSAPLGIAEADYTSRLETWREWQPVAELAQG